MKPFFHLFSLILATVGIVGLQFGMSDLLAIIFLWAAVVVWILSAGWRASRKEKAVTALVASITAVYLAPDPIDPGSGADRLYLFRVAWFILPVWILCLLHSVFRIHRFFETNSARSLEQTTA